MRQPQHLLPVLLATACLCLPAFSQESSKSPSPRVTIVHPGYDRMTADLDALLRLTDKKDQKYRDDLFEILEAFKVGVDGKRPIRVDVLINRLPYVVVGVPVTDASEFRMTTIGDLLGATVKRDRRDKGLYVASEEAGGTFYVREIGEYLFLGDQKNDVAPIALKDFGPDVAGLLAREFNLGGELVNDMKDKASQAARREKFQKSRQELMSALKQLPSETKEAFALRKLSTRHQLDELERLVAESAHLTVGTKLADKAAGATLTFEVEAIPDTGLSNDIAAFGKTASMFTPVPRDPKAILSLRVNHPISDFRKKNLNEFLASSLPDVLSRLKASKLTDAEKTAGEAFAKHLNKLLGEGVDGGIIDAFVEVTPEAGGHNTSVTGLKVPEGTALVELVKLLAATNAGHKLDANVAKFGSIDIHKLTVHLGPNLKKELGAFFSDSHEVYIGTGRASFWSAAGPNAQAKLKSAIEAVEAGAASELSPTVIDIKGRLVPWVSLHDKVYTAVNQSKRPAAGTMLRQLYDLRKLALEAMTTSDDTMVIKVARTESGLQGAIEVGQGVLRLLGKKVGEFAEGFSTE